MTLHTMKEISAERQRIIQVRTDALEKINPNDFPDAELRVFLREAVHRFFDTNLHVLNARFDVAEWYQSQ